MDGSATLSWPSGWGFRLRPACVGCRIRAQRNYHRISAVTDRTALGVGFVAYVMVGLNEHTKAAQEGFERAMAQAPEVRECHNITGAVEYLLRIEAADLIAYKRFHTEVLGTVAHVNAITSYVVMGSPKDARA